MKQKLQNDEFLSYAQKYFKLLKNWTDKGMREIFNGREKLFVLSYTKIDKVEIFHVLTQKSWTADEETFWAGNEKSSVKNC